MAECLEAPRPCPWVGCRHHLALEVDDAGGLRNLHASSSLPLNHDHVDLFASGVVRTLAELEETCSLDVARWQGATLSEVADLVGIGKTWTYELSEDALRLVRALIEDGKAQ